MKRLFLVFAVFTSFIFADDDYYFFKSSTDVKPATDQTYINECGSCHFAFQAGFLPKRSWEKMMKDLENHFETDASLEPSEYNYILGYLSENSADNATQYKRSRKMNASIPADQTPLKITEVPYFVREHREIPKRFVSQKEVGRLSNCIACHTTANKGIYSERAIKIPNYGRWDD